MDTKLEAFIKSLEQKYGESASPARIVHVLPKSSMKARGYRKVGRRIIAEVTSPFGGRYQIFANETAAQLRGAK